MKEEKTKRRAYELYAQRGQQDGSDQKDWFEAKIQLRHETLCDWIFGLLFIASFALTAYFSCHGFLLFSIFVFSVIAVLIITFYTSTRKKVNENLFRPLRASFNTFLKLIPAFAFTCAALTFVFNYQPSFAITGVGNQPDYQEVPIGNNIKLPETGIFFIKNESGVWVGKSRVRYWFISSKEEGEKATCYLDLSTSEENFNFGPKQSRGFLFSFGNAANKSNQDFDHLFLLMHHEHIPPLEPFAKKEIWEVYHYDPIKKLWITMRKNHPPRKKDFEQWKQALTIGNINIAECPAPQIRTEKTAVAA